jgi:two-component system response regulator FixJ
MKPEGTVFIVDDDPDVRQSLTRLMEEIHQPVRAFSGAGEFLEAYDPAQTSCLVLDVRMPGMSGTELQKKLLEDGVAIPVIIITGHGDVGMVVETMRRGATDFIEKPIRPQALIDSIQEALAQDRERRRFEAECGAVAARFALLTPREREELAVTGMTNKAIAAQLGVSSQAVDCHRTKALATMGAENVVELVKLMFKLDAGRNDPTVRLA